MRCKNEHIDAKFRLNWPVGIGKSRSCDNCINQHSELCKECRGWGQYIEKKDK